MDIDKLFSNKFVKDAALGTLKKSMKQNNVTSCVIKYNVQSDELDFEFYTGNNVVIPVSDLEYYKNAVNELLKIQYNDKF